MYYILFSGGDEVPENAGNLVLSGSTDLNQISIDNTERTISNMSKKRDSNNKDTIVPTYPDGSINYDGNI